MKYLFKFNESDFLVQRNDIFDDEIQDLEDIFIEATDINPEYKITILEPICVNAQRPTPIYYYNFKKINNLSKMTRLKKDLDLTIENKNIFNINEISDIILRMVDYINTRGDFDIYIYGKIVNGSIFKTKLIYSPDFRNSPHIEDGLTKDLELEQIHIKFRKNK
jgi:hypothetical protein